MVGYNVQAVVDAKHHLIIAHEVTNVGHDRSQLANMARQAKEVTGADGLTVLADRGYFSESLLRTGPPPLHGKGRGAGNGALRNARSQSPSALSKTTRAIRGPLVADEERERTACRRT